MTSSAERKLAREPPGRGAQGAGARAASLEGAPPGAAQSGRVPDFFIAGQPKSGTTALYEMLRSQPRIYMPVKEPWFFAREFVLRDDDDRPTSLERYLDLYAEAPPGQLVGEATPEYLRSAGAAARIAALRPDAKIIAILREPASFLRSLHMQLVQSHVERETDLARAIAREGADGPVYAERVRYVEQLERFDAVFPRQQMLVLIYDDFRADNEATLRRVLDFLGLAEIAPADVHEANPTVRVRSPRLHRAVRAISVGAGPRSRVLKSLAKALTPPRLRSRALELTYRRVVFAPPGAADEELMLALRRRFKGEVEALSSYLGRDLTAEWGYDRLD